MVKLEFLRSWLFVKAYHLVTIIVLILTFVFNLFGFGGNLAIQSIAGILTLIGIPLMIGQILLSMTVANKNDRVGWMIVRLSYITLIVACLGLLLITLGTFAFSLTFSASDSTIAARLLSIIGFSILVIFEIGFSVVCYYTLPIASAWSVTKAKINVKNK
ncbi:MAG: hypothetical protein HWN65_02635 [Candidatus Helarchaeota archaeon]|nr:hypothetical protein [Candidatus Helarchaeota archaeon]